MAKNAITALERKIIRLDRQVSRVLDLTAATLAKRITSKFMGAADTGQNKLAGRTGNLEKSVVIERATTRSGSVTSTVRITSRYAGVHFGRKGETTVIRPRSKKALTIPTAFAKDSRGATLARAQQIKDTRSGFIKNGIIFGRLGSSDEIKPLFTLAGSVRVPVRVDIQDNLLRPITKPLETRLARILREF